MGVFAVYEELGGVTTITDENGAVVQELSYDAWGNLRNPTTVQNKTTLFQMIGSRYPYAGSRNLAS